MNNFDVAGILRTYSEQCRLARSSEQLKKIVRDLKKELNAAEIKKLKISE